MSFLLPLLTTGAQGFIQGGGFGLGYGAGVRAGYEDLYPALKSKFEELAAAFHGSQFGSGLLLGLNSSK